MTRFDDGKYPRPTLDGSFHCQCGGQLITEHCTHGSLSDERDSYRVHCKWCPASSRWLCYELDAFLELADGMGILSNL